MSYRPGKMRSVIEIAAGAALAVPTMLMGTWFGIWLTRRYQRADAAVAEREQQLAQMEQLVVAISEMMTARTLYRETWLSPTTRWRVGGDGRDRVLVWLAYAGRQLGERGGRAGSVGAGDRAVAATQR
ncbi:MULTISPECIES: hypothetical protein [unclassified Streptomyces]|uniref:hypothetical protein n=1 Tax=unclassified Streptomyces TaxID=2593676 RepID=UPI00225BC7B6|nr:MULTISPECIES: hypothetical protein [unclassified Streptomyces]MCX5327923.1 hypothetical protein [Streptomyces sp. NBC_00140]MCX5357413.1 hypothetical protein [Streptomyces sp. NBC_00124]